MRTLFFLGLFFIAVQSFSAQSVNSAPENYIFEVADSLASNEFSGVIILETNEGDKKVFVNGMANDELKQSLEESDLFNLLSLGKSLTAAVTLKLVQEGKLKFQDTIIKYLPHREIPYMDKITIQQLLSHSSGLGDYMATEDYESLPDSEVNLMTLLSVIEQQPIKRKPGESFLYSNSGYIVLGAIIEAIGQDSYENILKEKVLQPAGIEEVRFSGGGREVNYYSGESREPVNEDLPPASSDGGIWMSAGDLSQFLNFLFSDDFTEESRGLLFRRILEFPDRGERKNGGIASSFLVYEYPRDIKVIGNNGGYKGSTYSAFRVLYNQKGERVIAIVLSNRQDTAGPVIKALENEIRKYLQ